VGVSTVGGCWKESTSTGDAINLDMDCVRATLGAGEAMPFREDLGMTSPEDRTASIMEKLIGCRIVKFFILPFSS
jgi:hypothetical protein